MIIDIATAKRKAQTHLTTIEKESGIRCIIISTRVRESVGGWYFSYQSMEYLTTGDFHKSLVGNWPIFVSRDGTVIEQRRPELD